MRWACAAIRPFRACGCAPHSFRRLPTGSSPVFSVCPRYRPHAHPDNSAPCKAPLHAEMDNSARRKSPGHVHLDDFARCKSPAPACRTISHGEKVPSLIKSTIARGAEVLVMPDSTLLRRAKVPGTAAGRFCTVQWPPASWPDASAGRHGCPPTLPNAFASRHAPRPRGRMLLQGDMGVRPRGRTFPRDNMGIRPHGRAVLHGDMPSGRVAGRCCKATGVSAHGDGDCCRAQNRRFFRAPDFRPTTYAVFDYTAVARRGPV
jgi:hypothetical protein